MSISLQGLKDTVVRIPVPGPAPCNTLVYVKCVNALETFPVNQGETRRFQVPLLSAFRIQGFDQRCPDFYIASTQISVAAFASQYQNDAESAFTLAVDSVVGSLDENGAFGAVVDIAFRSEDARPSLWLGVTVEAYILCYEGDLNHCQPA